MNQVWAAKWINALRSGKYKQTTGMLNDGSGFCCLGVLCDISKVGKWNSQHRYKVPNSLFSECLELPLEVKNLVGMTQTNPRLPESVYPNKPQLAQLNDGQSHMSEYQALSFKKIADLIEMFWEEL